MVQSYDYTSCDIVNYWRANQMITSKPQDYLTARLWLLQQQLAPHHCSHRTAHTASLTSRAALTHGPRDTVTRVCDSRVTRVTICHVNEALSYILKAVIKM